MKIVYIYCEGQTEESFINEVLAPYLANIMIFAVPIVCTTKRTASIKHRGGVSDYNKIKNEVQILCRQHKNAIITTMFDYYAMPVNTPEINCTEVDIYKRMDIIEKAINKDIGENNFFFNFILHEFEGLLFSSPTSFSEIANDNIVAKIQHMRDEATSPEHINNSPETAPSKRLESLIPNYAKITNGTLVSKKMGIDIILKECKHFSSWIEKIKTL
ncbi:DUF4276 domain-containing protein [Fusobacterium ulcerans]|uniref:DUF4276 domain-containing protein n=1 Tax=Fusobacterium ulcerans TaxID=861 RepID=A0AAX2JBS7_9FUSO|nr:DUF4276 family protein [Fusobacterium ulcerans]AVQ29342.1 DUF4276 domain-containing protein [Fusobacterium ulcerans]EFS27246.1 hypothetical protein FUAG_02761 [Fusobacterium ulcerans ATCC 49185]SQJ02754.1 Uncharacterised protein [Fusobacterium ulcerans]